MRIRPSVNQKNMTEQIVKPLNLSNMRQRVNAIKFRSSTKTFHSHKSGLDLQPQQFQKLIPTKNHKIIQPEGDTSCTNFWPVRPLPTPSTISVKADSHDFFMVKRCQDSRISVSRPRPQSHNIATRSRFKTMSKNSGRVVDPAMYEKQIKYFAKLYELLGNVLASIRTGFQDLENTVSEYGRFIRDHYLAFIDDFAADKSDKIKKAVRISRIHQYLSITYLFLEIAQQRLENNQSYLVNFIGYSLSNLIFIARLYILTERLPQFQQNQFERSVQQFQISSFGHSLTNIQDILLRIQHNNQIITMIHRKLGAYNSKFQECIKIFLKNAERRKYTTCLCAHYIFQYLSMHIHETELVGISLFLQVAPTPYLAPSKHQYTLVFEPIGILAQDQVLRPYLMQFVKWASKYFDLVMWTWEMPAAVQQIAQLLQPYLFSKLYRYHCEIKDQIFKKDLNRLGRDLKKTLIIDYDERIFSQTPKNGLVCRWKGSKKDKGLLVMCEVLEQMIGSESEVQDIFKFYAEELHAIRGI